VLMTVRDGFHDKMIGSEGIPRVYAEPAKA
jgi:hypothetical protein